MCVGGNFMKKALPLAALAATAYFSGGGSLASLFGGGAGTGVGAGAAASSVAPTAGVGAFTEAASSAIPSALASSGGMASQLGSGFGTIGSALNFAKNNAYLVGQGLNAAGTVANYIGNNQMLADMNKAKNYANSRNAELSAEASRINSETLGNFDVQNQNSVLDGAYQSRAAALSEAQKNPYSMYMPDSGSAPKEVKEANASRIADIVDFGRSQMAAGAKLNAYGDLNASNSMALSNASQKINTLQNFAQGNNSVLDNQLNLAMMKPRAATTIGSALKGAGTLSNIYASTRPKIA